MRVPVIPAPMIITSYIHRYYKSKEVFYGISEYKVISNNSFSRVRKEYKYDWDVVSDEDDNAINEIINDYRNSNNKFKEYEKNINLTYIATTIIC